MASMTKTVAAFDLGTNSFICLIGSGDEQNNLVIHQELIESVRLGEGYSKTGSLSAEALERAKDCLQRFAKVCDQHQVQKKKALATAAAREAKNGSELLKICADLGIQVEIVSGEQEATYSYLGATYNLSLPDTHRIILDIGGGSSEVIVASDNRISHLGSLPIGAVKISEKYFSSASPGSGLEKKSLHEAAEAIRAEISQGLRETLNLESVDVANYTVIGIAGTPTSLQAARWGRFDEEKIHGSVLTEQDLADWVEALAPLSVLEIQQRYNFGKRSDIILAGTMILKEFLKQLGATNLVVSTKGVRYGLLQEMLQNQ